MSMDRRLALAASVGASVALVSGAVMVGALLSASPPQRGAPDLAAAPSVDTDSVTVTSLDPVVVYQDEYEYVVTGGQAAAPRAESASEQPGGSAVASTAPTGGGAAGPVVAAPAGPTPTTAAPAPATTTTTRPVGVPSDWPADKPIPPMPANCRQPQLEDNGVWNCQR
jgi:hypothetical protein